MRLKLMWQYFLIIPVIVVLFGLLIGVEVLLAKRGEHLDFHNPPSQPVRLGQGETLTYVVLGDSTAAGQGASSYKTGIAESTARYLARDHAVTYVNLAISGARVADVLQKELAAAVKYKPDVVLLSIGANDVTHNTSQGSVRKKTQAIVTQLFAANCSVKIILTGVPEMGAIPRLSQPLRWLAGVKEHSLNGMFRDVVQANQLTFAPIAEKTGPAFRAHPDLFAADRFHPNDKGYALWIPVLERALDEAQANQPDHCEVTEQ
jgi:lysophospholipase L1-like esterase